VEAAKKHGASVTSVCNALGCSPAALEQLVGEARAAGYAVEVSREAVEIRSAAPVDAPVEVAPIVGDRQIVGAISDPHFGSRYCLRAQLKDFVAYAYENGVREILCAGDLLDGCYRHGRFELSHHGIDEQSQDAVESLPAHPGLSYHAVCGNHDQTFTAEVGVEVGPYIEARFRAAGRTDLHVHGNASAYLRVRGALIHLWHPKGGPAYALSYPVQKKIESYPPGLKPDVALIGHLHKSVSVTTRGVRGFLVPCFQGPGSAFSNSLVGPPVNGGLILSWRLTEHGTLRSFRCEEMSYYHDERPREIVT
jgi:predicted phosphodiesterase